MATKEKISYKNSMEELESILFEMENDDLDIDKLTENISRASFLLKTCKQMLRSAEKEVDIIMKETEDD